jgi:ribonuclease HI
LKKELLIYTDGSSIPRNKFGRSCGGWAAVFVFPENQIETVGFEVGATNNQMELQSVIEALKGIHILRNLKNWDIKIYADSAYVVNGVNDWFQSWEKNNFKTAGKKDVKNLDQWRELMSLYRKLKNVKILKIKGHSGFSGNVSADESAGMASMYELTKKLEALKD